MTKEEQEAFELKAKERMKKFAEVKAKRDAQKPGEKIPGPVILESEEAPAPVPENPMLKVLGTPETRLSPPPRVEDPVR
ncbi:hypothetical protein [Haloferula sp. BvORR071]|uniref:hypothetical protein n=1 Tax=Haloferula sp. BvORR071 TaxID=1396141 RepID=UPI000557E253|nr:hypothetical protein [Haloferula sp. BvORR071]